MKEKKEIEIERVNSIIEEITKQIEENIFNDRAGYKKTQKQRHSINPRLPYPYNKQERNKPGLATNNQVRHNPGLYYKLNNRSGCNACKRRLWDPL